MPGPPNSTARRRDQVPLPVYPSACPPYSTLMATPETITETPSTIGLSQLSGDEVRCRELGAFLRSRRDHRNDGL